jgi:hypothetical protein
MIENCHVHGHPCINLFVLHVQVVSPVQLSSDVKPWLMLTRQGHDQCRPDSAIVSKTRQQHYATTNVALVVPSSARLGSDVTPWPTSTQQHHNQHCLSSAIVSKTQEWHHTMANVTSAMLLSTWLDSNIAPRLTSPR